MAQLGSFNLFRECKRRSFGRWLHFWMRCAWLVLAIAPVSCRINSTDYRHGIIDRDERWREDIRVYAHELPRRHANLYFRVSREQMDRAVNRLLEDVPRLTEHQIVFRLMELTASIGDGHTRISGLPPMRKLPIRLQRFSDGLFVVQAVSPAIDALGTQVIQIGGHSIDDALARVARIIPHDNEAQLHVEAPGWLTVPNALHALEATASIEEVEVRFRRADRSELTLRLAPLPIDLDESWTSLPDPRTAVLPNVRRNVQLPYWFEQLTEASTLYIAYNKCADWEQRPFDRFAREAFQVVEDQKIRRVVVDLRNNGGGDSRVAAPLIRRLAIHAEVNDPQRLFVLIGRKTFSSALLNALELRDKTLATFIGEPTGGKPNHYGEIRSFRLPYSRLQLSYSTRYFRTIRTADPPSLEPDIRVETSSADFFAGRDPVLETATRAAGRFRRAG